MRAKNISRYNYKKTAFQGWRLAITRKGHTFIKYFADAKYGDFRESFKAAVEARNAILYELKNATASPETIFNAAKELLTQQEAEDEA
ncbi:MAG: hypothetical protein Q4A24_05605 [Akkermansia sp.]|nr:hypothetical protein [Akkermansia sp.]MDO4751564.1 hypothetical protein [Akkermansia sp.]